MNLYQITCLQNNNTIINFKLTKPTDALLLKHKLYLQGPFFKEHGYIFINNSTLIINYDNKKYTLSPDLYYALPYINTHIRNIIIDEPV